MRRSSLIITRTTQRGTRIPCRVTPARTCRGEEEEESSLKDSRESLRSSPKGPLLPAGAYR